MNSNTPLGTSRCFWALCSLILIASCATQPQQARPPKPQGWVCIGDVKAGGFHCVHTEGLGEAFKPYGATHKDVLVENSFWFELMQFCKPQ